MVAGSDRKQARMCVCAAPPCPPALLPPCQACPLHPRVCHTLFPPPLRSAPLPSPPLSCAQLRRWWRCRPPLQASPAAVTQRAAAPRRRRRRRRLCWCRRRLRRGRRRGRRSSRSSPRLRCASCFWSTAQVGTATLAQHPPPLPHPSRGTPERVLCQAVLAALPASTSSSAAGDGGAADWATGRCPPCRQRR